MPKETLKSLMKNDPNAFWDFVALEGISEETRKIMDEVESEMDGSNIELSPLIDCQGV